jgi:hypothetical protein
VGAGKTTAAAAAAEVLETAGVAHALVDRDALTDLFPRSPGDRLAERYALANPAALRRHARAARAQVLVMAGVIAQYRDIGPYQAAVPGSVVTVVELRAPLDVLHARLRQRESGPSLRWHLQRAAELTEALARTDVGAIPIDATMAPAMVADAILQAAGLPRRLTQVPPSQKAQA